MQWILKFLAVPAAAALSTRVGDDLENCPPCPHGAVKAVNGELGTCVCVDPNAPEKDTSEAEEFSQLMEESKVMTGAFCPKVLPEVQGYKIEQKDAQA
jgi:hypothetical protein